MLDNHDFKIELEKKVQLINDIIEEKLPENKGLQKLIFEAMHYSVTAGGKRIRPLLLSEAFFMCGGDMKSYDTVKVFMAAIEYIHNYSLVHDDLPAMDNDEYRRNRKTTHAVYGAGMGTLTGDALLNYAYEIIADELVKNPSKETISAFNILSKKAGVFGMVGGQVVDVDNSGKPLTEGQIDFIYRLKTAALIEAPLMIGAVLAKKDETVISDMENIGRKIGLAFQIQDDILDITSTDEVLGKPVHSDEKNEKTTFVSIHGIEESKKYVNDYSNEAIKILRKYGENSEFIIELAKMLINREK